MAYRDSKALALGNANISGNLGLTAGGAVTQAGGATLAVGGTTSLSAAGQDITLANAGNNFGGSVQIAAGKNVSLRDVDALDLAASTVTGKLTLNAGGAVTQSGALTVAGGLDVTTTHVAGNVAIDNSAAAATQLGDSLVGGNYTLTATGKGVTQVGATEIDVAGDFNVNAASGTMQAANVVAGVDNSQPGTTVIKQVGIITLGDVTAAGNLSVSSIGSAKTFAGPAIGGSAVTLTNAGNNIGGPISVHTQAPVLNAAGAAVATGIQQAAGTKVTAAGNSMFTAGGGSIALTNAGNNFAGNLTTSADSVTLRNSTVGGMLAINATSAAALSDLTVGGAASITNGGATSLNGALQIGGDFTVAGTGGGAVALTGNTTIDTTGTGAVSFGAMAGGASNLTVTAHDVNLTGNWNGTGAYTLRPNSASKTVGIGGAGTFNLSAGEMAFLSNANSSRVTIGRSDGTGALTLGAFSFDDPLSLFGGNVSFGAGNYVLSGGLDLAANGNVSFPAGAVNISSTNRKIALAATGNIIFNASGSAAITTNGGAITLNARSGNDAAGYIDLRNTTLTSGGGNITIGGGSDPGTGYAIGATVNGVRLGGTTISSGAGNVVINGQSGTVSGVSMGTSSTSSILATSGNVTISGVSDGAAGITMSSGTVSGGQTIATTTGNISLTGVSASGDGARIGSTTANTTVTLQTQGGNIQIAGTGGDTGNGLNIGAGTVTLQTTGSGRIALNGVALGSGSGVTLGPSTSATTTSVSTTAGNVSVTGTSASGYGINFFASGSGGVRAASNIDTVSGNITMLGTSASNVGYRNNPASTGDTRMQTVSGDISITGISGSDVGLEIKPQTSGGNVGSATVAATGSGNITLSGNQIGLDGTRTRITGAGGVLTLEPVTPGTTVGFGTGAAGTLNFTNAQLAAIGGTFSAIKVGNLSAGRWRLPPRCRQACRSHRRLFPERSGPRDRPVDEAAVAFQMAQVSTTEIGRMTDLPRFTVDDPVDDNGNVQISDKKQVAKKQSDKKSSGKK